MIYLLLIFILGILLNYTYKHSNKIKDYTNIYLIWLGLPLLIFISLINNKESILSFGNFFLISFLFLAITNILLFFIIKKIKLDKKKQASLFLASVYANTGYIGIPIAAYFFQEKGAILAAIFTLVTSLFHFSLGVYLSNSYKGKPKSALQNVFKFPILWGILIAFALSFLITNVPSMLAQFSQLAVYLALFVVGLTFRIEKIELSFLYGFFLKFILLPVIMFLILLFFNLTSIQTNALILFSFLPPAFASVMIAINYKFDEQYASGLISILTLVFLLGVFVFGLLV